MTLHYELQKGDALFIHHPKTGYIRAWAAQDMELFGPASMNVTINSTALPGVSAMTINVNTWDVWKQDDPDVLKKIASEFVTLEWTR